MSSVINFAWHINPFLAEQDMPSLNKQCRSRSVGSFRSLYILFYLFSPFLWEIKNRHKMTLKGDMSKNCWMSGPLPHRPPSTPTPHPPSILPSEYAFFWSLEISYLS